MFVTQAIGVYELSTFRTRFGEQGSSVRPTYLRRMSFFWGATVVRARLSQIWQVNMSQVLLCFIDNSS